MIINILSNAGRFTHTGGVMVKTCAASDQLEISITDTGPGIPEETSSASSNPSSSWITRSAASTAAAGWG